MLENSKKSLSISKVNSDKNGETTKPNKKEECKKFFKMSQPGEKKFKSSSLFK